MRRRINVRDSSNLREIQDRHAQIKARLLRSIKHQIADQKFKETSYTDATMMLVETDITVQMRQNGQDRLFKTNPNYYEILWGYFAVRFIDLDWVKRMDEPSKLFATMMNAVAELGGIPHRELYEMIMDEDRMSYCGVKGSFQRVRVPGEDRYENCLKIDEVSSIEHLYEASIRLCCVAIDAYLVNFLSGWTDLDYGPPYNCMNRYLERFGITEVFSLDGSEEDLYNNEPEAFMSEEEIAQSAREWLQAPALSFGPEDVRATIDYTVDPEAQEAIREGGWDEPDDLNPDKLNWRNAGINRMLP